MWACPYIVKESRTLSKGTLHGSLRGLTVHQSSQDCAGNRDTVFSPCCGPGQERRSQLSPLTSMEMMIN